MVDPVGAVLGNHRGRRHGLSEKRRKVELTLQPGASVAQVARANGVNGNQLFSWRRSYERGELVEPVSGSTALLPVALSAVCESPARKAAPQEQPPACVSTHIELPGRALISVESGARRSCRTQRALKSPISTDCGGCGIRTRRLFGACASGPKRPPRVGSRKSLRA